MLIKQNARAEWASYDVGQDPGEWTGGAGPSMPEASQYNQDGAFDEAGYNGAMETYYQQKSEYDTKHAQWEKQSQEYANRVAEKERLRQARDNAARDYASKKDSYEDSARTLDDAKESRNSYVAKKNKYSSDNKFNPR